MRFRTVLAGACGLACVLASVLIALTTSATSVAGQEAAPPRAADIRLGSCANLGEVVAPLAPLAVPAGDPQGHAGATPVDQSVTEVPLLLPHLLTERHTVAVHASPEANGTPLVCGEIGGTVSDDGTLSIGLQPMNGATRSGVASFAPTAAGDATIVTLLLIEEQRSREPRVADGNALDESSDAVGTGADDAGGDASNAADGVGNVTVGPAPAPARGTGDDAMADRPGRDRDGGRGGAGDRDHKRASGSGEGASAGEDGRNAP